MPELPEIVVYIEALKERIQGHPLSQIGLRSPFFLRSVEPPLDVLRGAVVQDVRRLGKRIVYVFEHELYLVLHLMIAGRLRWRSLQQPLGISPKMVLATLEFDHGTVVVSEAGSKKRASMHLVHGVGALAEMDPGGIEPLEASLDALTRVLTAGNHTLKRALTDPHLVSGVGNAFSDEILHAARLSPLRLTRTLRHEEIERLWIVMRETFGSSVGPTASDSMLKPRRANMPEILARTPGLFSTSTLRTCVPRTPRGRPAS